MKKMLFVLLIVTLTVAVFAESRNALLIANGKYKSFSSLANPVPEAEGLKKSLIELGFDVTIVTNASKEQMETAILDFQKKLSANKGIGFFHYGGHAVQVNGENYLIPADADIPDEPRVSSRAVNVSEIMYSMQADTNIVILDSCRNNPLPSGSGRSASRGLQMVKVRPKNSVIVYSAEAGKTAQDGVFTPILTKRILENKELIAVLRDVRNEVAKATNDEQTPGQYDQLRNEVFLAANVPSRLSKVEAEASALDKQLEALRAKRAAAGSQEEQNRIAIETQKVEAEKKRKELELQQVREAEARRAAEQKRITEENAKKNENQRLQEQQFAKMQSENAAKLKEIERLSTATNIDDMVSSANSLYQTIKNIENSYTSSMNKAIEETKTFYQKKKATIVKSKYESEAEFAERRKSEESALEAQQNDDITALKKRYENEIVDNTKELKRKLQSLENQTETIVGNSIKLTFGEYNAEQKLFPVTVTDTVKKINRYVSLYVYDYEMIDGKPCKLSTERFIKNCQKIENKIKTGGYIGYVEYCIELALSYKYFAKVKQFGVKTLEDNKTVVSSAQSSNDPHLYADKIQRMRQEEEEKKALLARQKIERIKSLNHAIYDINGWINWIERIVCIIIAMTLYSVYFIKHENCSIIVSILFSLPMALMVRVAFGFAVSVLKHIIFSCNGESYIAMPTIYIYFVVMAIIYAIGIGFGILMVKD